jgi:Uncharacterized protein conserved in bacteria (DUF2330)
MRKAIWLGTLLGVGLALPVIAERDARACGGCFVPPSQNVDSQITGEQMIFSISTLQSTLYDEITYSGSPSTFAWVLPIKGKADVGLSADVLFATLNQLTASTVEQPPTNCPPPPTCYENGFGGASTPTGAAADAGGAASLVTVITQEQVGPYETVQLSSKDGSALTNWLTSNGYNIPASDQPSIDHYVAEGMDFLALKLVPGKGVNAMQPVRVTIPGAYPVLPLRMVAVGTGANTGITLWIVAEGRWEPKNFPFFTITDSELAWDWNTDLSNFEQVRQSKAAAFHGAGWLLESSIDLSQYSFTESVQQAQQYLEYSSKPVGGYTLPAPGSTITGDAGRADGGIEGGLAEASTATEEASTGGDAGEEAALLAAAQNDVDVLFAGIKGGTARVTRLRGDIAHTALKDDLVIQASANPAEISNIYNTTQEIGQPLCPVYNASCQQTGVAPRAQAQAAAAAASSGCSTTATSSRLRSGWTLGALSAVVGFLGFRARRRRERRG